MHASTPQPLSWRQRLTLGAALALFAAAMTVIGLAPWLAHQRATTVVPVAPPLPVAPAPVEPGPPTIVIPDNA